MPSVRDGFGIGDVALGFAHLLLIKQKPSMRENAREASSSATIRKPASRRSEIE
jgi:hypothetical protein